MFAFENDRPIIIIVKEDRYDAYGPETPRSRQLMATLQRMGGINESVAPGLYHFNVIHQDGQLLATLTPFED